MYKNCLSVEAYYCNIYQELMTLLVEKKVDLILHAHDHTYQRIRQLATGSPCVIVKVDSVDDDCVVDSGEDNVNTIGAGPVFYRYGGHRSGALPNNPERPGS